MYMITDVFHTYIIQVYTTMVTMEFGIHMITRVNNTSLVIMTKTITKKKRNLQTLEK